MIVLGESCNRDHMSLYGYCRETTPRLSAIENELVVYKDAVSPAIQTLVALKRILSFSDHGCDDMFIHEASIVELLRDAGYKTYWVDNQGTGGIDTFAPTSYRAIAHMCDSCIILPNGLHDEEVLPYVS